METIKVHAWADATPDGAAPQGQPVTSDQRVTPDRAAAQDDVAAHGDARPQDERAAVLDGAARPWSVVGLLLAAARHRPHAGLRYLPDERPEAGVPDERPEPGAPEELPAAGVPEERPADGAPAEGTFQSYGQLLDEARRIATGLAGRGGGPRGPPGGGGGPPAPGGGGGAPGGGPRPRDVGVGPQGFTLLDIRLAMDRAC
ncbi:hypothetical protein AAHZ94_30680, partial [Streptomyces sp. HSW2009]